MKIELQIKGDLLIPPGKFLGACNGLPWPSSFSIAVAMAGGVFEAALNFYFSGVFRWYWQGVLGTGL